MNNHIKHASFLAINLIVLSSSANFFDAMFEELEANIKEMRQSMQEVSSSIQGTTNSFNQKAVAYDITSDTDNIIVSIKGLAIPADKINEQVTINPTHNAVTVHVEYEDGYATFAFTSTSIKMRSEHQKRAQVAQKETDTPDTTHESNAAPQKTAAKNSTVTVSHSFSENYQSLPDTVDLSKISAEYNADEKTLVITLPKRHKKISVNVKQKPEITLSPTDVLK